MPLMDTTLRHDRIIEERKRDQHNKFLVRKIHNPSRPIGAAFY